MQKRTFFLLLGYFFLTDLFAQTVNDVPFKNIDVEYLQIVGSPKPFTNKLNIEIDFGQENKLWSQKDTQLKDSAGNLVALNSMVDALNFMSKNGYEFVQAYTLDQGKQNVYYILRKKTIKF